MQFNSIDFAIFLPIVFLLYWFVINKNLKIQNIFLVVVSYIFYGWWDWRFLFLIFVSTIVDYFVGMELHKNEEKSKRKFLLWLSIGVNLSLLGFFKYYNFFLDNFINAYSFLGYKINANSLNIILPVGISFYTFQTMSYTIDVYKRKLKPTKDFVSFAAFVSFFPQLVAGPIERATRLLPQFFKQRTFHYEKAVDGFRQILWGLFKKIVIADNCAEYVNTIFGNSDKYSASTLLLGAFLFSFQIYCDFSGYSDIAIGTARLFGFELTKNFNFPFFSRSIPEFWRKWHISFLLWMRDYVYYPLSNIRESRLIKMRNIFIIYILTGFWHGANWTFIVWGIVTATFFIPSIFFNRNRKNTIASKNNIPSLKEFFQMIVTFGLFTLSIIIFRAENLSHALKYFSGMVSLSLFSIPQILPKSLILSILFFIIIEWLGRDQQYAIAKFGIRWNRPLRYSFYYSLIIIILFFADKEQEFIYFQF